MHAVHGSHHRSLKKAFMFKDSMFEGEIHEFWGEALKTAVHVCIKSPHVSLKGSIPEDFWFGKLASYDHLRIFGYDAFVQSLS